MVIVNSTIEDIDILFERYEQATGYQQEVGIKTWKGFDRTAVAQEIKEKRQWKIMEDGEIACVFVITYNDPAIWGAADADPAIYIHRIATNPLFRGKHYVKDIVAWAKKHAFEHSKTYIRMDTGSGNEKLNNYYVSCGFTYKGITGIADATGLPDHYKMGTFSLFELKLNEKIGLYQVDAFTDHLFGGNPAGVVVLESWLPDRMLLNIAKENGVPETAFIIEEEGGTFALRWFNAEHEMDLCGHATLAASHVLKTILNYNGAEIVFNSKSGRLTVKAKEGVYTLNFPSRMPVDAALPEVISQSLNKQPVKVLKARDYVLVYENEQDIIDIAPNRELLNQISLEPGGIIFTAKGNEVDFVSRFFIPQASIFEDPVTGSAHCSLIPYWAEQLGKKEMNALQLSERRGKLKVAAVGDRVLISGTAVTYSAGVMYIN